MGVMRRREFLRRGALAAGAASWQARGLSAAVDSPRVVVIGAGFAGGACALQLRRVNPSLHITLIDPDLRYVTCPMSSAVLVDLRSMGSITVTRAGMRRAGVHYRGERVTAIDPGKRRVRLSGGGEIGYDRLVVAPGIRLLFGTPEGYDAAAALRMPHAWQAGAQTQLLAAQLHSMSDGGTVAISVPTGLMRCPPGPYERASLIAHWLKQHRPRSKVLLFDANNQFPRQDLFTAAWQELYPGMIEWIPPAEGGAVMRVDVRTSTLYTASGAHRVALANIIPPQAPGQLALDAGLASGHGWCPVKPASFESELMDNVHVIGDACIAGAMPKAASAAHSQAVQCAAAIAAAFEGRAAPVADLDSVCYSLLGRETALAMRGRYELAEGEIRQVKPVATQTPDQAPSAQHLTEAAAWYAQIRAECFAS
jgi:sulfide dehydrogenase [flavocytochrome c] flavoprotein subunit